MGVADDFYIVGLLPPKHDSWIQFLAVDFSVAQL